MTFNAGPSIAFEQDHASQCRFWIVLQVAALRRGTKFGYVTRCSDTSPLCTPFRLPYYLPSSKEKARRKWTAEEEERMDESLSDR
jgi:hypothetical protein